MKLTLKNILILIAVLVAVYYLTVFLSGKLFLKKAYMEDYGNTVISQDGTILCEDSDGGINYYDKGNLTNYDGSTWSGDCCSDGGVSCIEPGEGQFIIEKICQPGKKPMSSVITRCSNGCKDGQCLLGDKEDCTVLDIDADQDGVVAEFDSDCEYHGASSYVKNNRFVPDKTILEPQRVN